MKNLFLALIFLLTSVSAHAFPAGGGNQPLMEVATGTGLASSFGSTANQCVMTRKMHFMRSSISSLNVVYPNFAIYGGSITADVGVEASPNNITIQSWIEYPLGSPSGTTVQATFGGANIVTIAPNQIATSDNVSVTIPNGAQFATWTRECAASGGYLILHASNSNGLVSYTAGGEAVSIGATGSVPTAPGTITNNSALSSYYPAAIIGINPNPTFCLVGDSRVEGIAEIPDATYDVGSLARSLGPSYAYLNMGIGGDWASTFAFSHQGRMQLAQYCDHVVEEYGINEFTSHGASTTATAALAYKMDIAHLFQGKKFAWTTLEPVTTSTDSWATMANQTPVSYNTGRVAFNDALRANTYGIPVFDIATAVETALDSGYWQTNGTANAYTADGIHASALASVNLVKNSGAVNPTTAVNAPISAIPQQSTNLTLTSVTYDTATPKFGTGAMSGGKGQVYGVSIGTPNQTLETWEKTTSNNQFMVGNGAMNIGVNSSGYALVSAGSSSVAGNTAINDGNWHHIAGTLSCPNPGTSLSCTEYVFVDGVLQNSIAENVAPVQFGVSACPFTLRSTCTGATAFTGEVDEVAEWNTAKYTASFTPPTAPYVGTEPNLVAVWHLDGNGNGTPGPAMP